MSVVGVVNIHNHSYPCVGVRFCCSNSKCCFEERRILHDFNEGSFYQAHQMAVTNHLLTHVKKASGKLNMSTLAAEEVRCEGIIEPRFFVQESEEVIIEGKGDMVFAICPTNGDTGIWFSYKKIDIHPDGTQNNYGQALMELRHEHKKVHGRCSGIFISPPS